MVPVDTSKGWLPDLLSWELPDGGCQDILGLIPHDEGWEPIKTETQYGTATITGQAVKSKEFIHSNGSRYIFVGTIAGIFRVNPDKTITNVTQGSSYIYQGGIWDFEQYGDWIIAVNGYDPPQVLKDFATGTAFQNLGGNPPSAICCLLYMGHLIFGGLGIAIQRGTTDTRVANSPFDYQISGTNYTKATTAAGTALAVGTIPASKWGVYRYQINAAGTISCLAGAANFTTGYDDEATAIAALPALTASNAAIGYITVKASISGFVGGTDALVGGTSGNPASYTNYYVDGRKMPTRLCWSSLEAIETWITTFGTPLSGGSDAQDRPEFKGPIVALMPMQFGYAVFSSRGIAIATYIGSPYTFGFQFKTDRFDCIYGSPVSIPGGVIFWSYDDFLFFNGETVESVGHGIRNTVFRPYYGSDTATVNSQVQFKSGCEAAHDYSKGIIYWLYGVKHTTLNRTAIIAFNYRKRVWSYIKSNTTVFTGGLAIIRNAYVTFGTPTDELFYVKGSSGGVYTFTGDYVTTSYITTKEVSSPEAGISLVRRVRPLMSDSTAQPSINIIHRYNEQDSKTVGSSASVSATTGWADVLIANRYISVRVTFGTSTQNRVLMNGVLLDIVPAGLS